MKNPIKILIADDSSLILIALEHILVQESSQKFEVVKAENGHDACVIAFKERPDLILIDIEMPIMNGVEAIKHIRSNSKIKNIPIIVMSTSRDFEAALEAGANDFLLKPINRFEVLQRLKLNINLSQKALEVRNTHEELKIQKKEADIQRDTIKLQRKELLDDLQYASYLQKAILPEKKFFDELVPYYFVMYEPKNIVSGDFYWVSQKDDLLFMAVGDCTGHGLSGALMSMMGASLLHEIINGYNIIEPDSILQNIRTRIINLLHQKGHIGEASNGMDLALCVFNKRTRKLQYAGANNPIYIIRKNKVLEIFKADRMPIGIHINHERPFTIKETILEIDDILYMFTDGYADQFGGVDGQKFRYNQFQELLVNLSMLSMEEQECILKNKMVEWKGDLEQVDDILIMGVRL